LSFFPAALSFILAQQRGLSYSQTSAIRRRYADLPAGKKVLHSAIYDSPKSGATPIVFLHGMSPLGISDPRQVRAVQALVHAGFRVICPEIPAIRNLHIEAGSITVFIALLKNILADRVLAPGGRLALFAPSFSGAICLKAATDAGVADRISAVCAMGSLAGIRGSMEYLFLSAEADAYARFIVLANYLPLVKKYAALGRVFSAMAHDNWSENAAENPLLPGIRKTGYTQEALRKLKAAQRKTAESLRDDGAFRAGVFTELAPFMEKEIAAYDVLSVAPQITAPVFLLHGESDNVIPPQESQQLAARLRKNRLVISPFVGHGDSKVSISRIPDIFRLINGFAWYFKQIGA
jgi:pimeloyl-ACP methyl ester carboxylesterase